MAVISSNLQETLSLTRSLVIKFDIQNDLMNKRLESLGIGYSSDPAEWKYNLNLAGLYHLNDKPMNVKSNDDQETILFSKEVLTLHPRTKAEYKLGADTYYDELVAEYPNQSILINSITRDIEIDDVVNALDFQILDYDRSLVASNELTLISKLQEEIYAFKERWWNKDFVITDRLYPAAFIGILYKNIPSMIINIRKSLSHTSEASQFHIWSYLNDHYSIGEYRDVLTHEQSMWLYRNIEYIRRKSGRSDVLASLINDFMEGSGLEVVQLRYMEDNTFFESSRSREASFSYLPYDENQFSETTVKETLTDVVLNEISGKGLGNESDQVADKNTLTKLGKVSTLGHMPTSFLKVNQDGSVTSQTVDRFALRWKTYAYLGHLGIYEPTFDIELPNGRVRTLKARDAIILYYYSLNSSLGLEFTNIPTLKVQGMMPDVYPSKTVMRNHVTTKNVTDADLDYLLSLHTTPGSVNSNASFEKLITDTINARLLQELYWESGDTGIQRSELEAAAMLTWKTEDALLAESGASYKDWLKTIQVNKYDFSTNDWHKVTQTILLEVLGVGENSSGLPADQQAIINLMEELTSYTVRFLEGEGSLQELRTELPNIFHEIHSVRSVNAYDVEIGPEYQHHGSKTSQEYLYDIEVPFDNAWFQKDAQHYIINSGADIDFYKDGTIEIDTTTPSDDINLDTLDD